jgi:hypothetical protein
MQEIIAIGLSLHKKIIERIDKDKDKENISMVKYTSNAQKLGSPSNDY